ncbi:MAG: Sir2 family NAD-dependent protein deacetylase [Proteobacteria bacterium]|nr:Sir2 family NAD-dependent protein deacetylase [Pseudomonadota bacterium]
MTNNVTDDLDQFRRLLDSAHRVVVFTGAGISTESGIPDFRSPGTGLWTKIKPIQFQDFVASDSIRQESWRRRFSGERTIENAQPNKGHEAIAKLIREGKATAVITQNVDNLHQNSGIDANHIIELHGNATYAACLDCRTRYELVEIEQQFTTTGRVAPCSRCGGIIKSATISFGQAMPEHEMRRAQEQTLACDLFIVVGSSLVVYPAAGFPEMAKEIGAKLVIINREPTPLDPIADLLLHREIGQTLAYAVGIN